MKTKVSSNLNEPLKVLTICFTIYLHLHILYLEFYTYILDITYYILQFYTYIFYTHVSVLPTYIYTQIT